jgi:hypothetical protein
MGWRASQKSQCSIFWAWMSSDDSVVQIFRHGLAQIGLDMYSKCTNTLNDTKLHKHYTNSHIKTQNPFDHSLLFIVRQARYVVMSNYNRAPLP